MKKWMALISAAGILAYAGANVRADDTAKKIRDDFKPSLVVVKYTLRTEMVTSDLSTEGIVIGDDGLVAFPSLIVSPGDVPEEQITNMKVIIPSDDADETELDAVYQGRDERTNLAFVKTKDKQTWKSVKFVDSNPETGDPVYSIALLPKTFGFRPNITQGMVSTRLRGPVPQYLVDGNLAGGGAVVLNSKEEAIGIEQPRTIYEALLDSPNARANAEIPMSLVTPSRFFIPSSDFLQTINSPPTPENPVVIPWIGLPEPTGVEQKLAEYLGIKGVPAVQVGDIVKGSPAEKAGLQISDVIIKMNGESLERGDVPDEVPLIMTRKIQRMKVGDVVTFTVLRQKGDPTIDIKVTLEKRPPEPSDARRYYAKDLGLVVRDAVFIDYYMRKRGTDTGGVVVATAERNQAADAAHLQPNDLIVEMNGKPVKDVTGFKSAYEDLRTNHAHDPIVLEVYHVNNQAATLNIQPPQ